MRASDFPDPTARPPFLPYSMTVCDCCGGVLDDMDIIEGAPECPACAIGDHRPDCVEYEPTDLEDWDGSA